MGPIVSDSNAAASSTTPASGTVACASAPNLNAISDVVPHPPDTEQPRLGVRVLIVDDELSNRRLAARMLQRLKIASDTLEDGDEVLLRSALRPVFTAGNHVVSFTRRCRKPHWHGPASSPSHSIAVAGRIPPPMQSDPGSSHESWLCAAVLRAAVQSLAWGGSRGRCRLLVSCERPHRCAMLHTNTHSE